MAKIEQFSRLINHGLSTSGQPFTIPTSNDHTDETWISTDLYIGEIGINITDDTVFMRTNNGIVQIATGTSSGSTASVANIWSFDTPDIVIGSTYSADSVSPYSGYYTDLGKTSLRWKDIYLGGSGTGYATINSNSGLNLTDASSNGILSTNGAITGNHPIEINTLSSSTTKNRILYLNTYGGYATGSTNYITSIATNGVTFSNSTNAVSIAGTGVVFDDNLSNVVHLGVSKNKTNYNSDEIVVGGQLAVRGVEDDGSNQYGKSDWITSQDLLRTSNALTTTIVTIPWLTTGGGDVIQVKAYIVGTDISDATKVYSSEIMGCYSIDSNLTLTQVGTPILNAISSYVGTQPDSEMASDGSGVYVQVTGVGTDTIQWLCSYSYHRLINVTP